METTPLKPGGPVGGARTFVVHDGKPYDIDELARIAPGWYDRAFLDQRRRDKRRIERVGWTITGAILAIMLIMAMLGGGTDPADAAAPPVAAVTCNEACQLNRRLVAVCPSQPGAMTRRRCVQWVQVAQCETGGQQRRVTLRSIGQIGWRYDGRSGYDGGLQFSPTTWTSNVGRIPARQLTRYQRLQRNAGRYHHAWSAPASVQILASEVLRLRPDSTGLGNWPTCGAWWYG